MKKILLFCICAIIPALSLLPSCKKILHSNNPIPNNYRILSYTKTTNSVITLPAYVVPRAIIENFRFYYNKDNTVQRISYTTNDTAHGNTNMSMSFTYYHDTIEKRYFDIRTNGLLRIDTFVQNATSKLITTTFTQGLYKTREKTTFEYLGQLLGRVQKSTYSSDNSYHNKGTTITGPLSTYTSDNGDFLKHTYGTTLTANFTTQLVPPLTADWMTLLDWNQSPGALYTEHTPVGGYSDVLPNYGQLPLYLIVHDADSTDTCSYYGTVSYPGALWLNESYNFYTTMAHRPGDFLQVESFTMYGTDIYRNNHLVSKIYSTLGFMDITYSIDAYSKITQFITNTTDQYLNKFSSTYDIQYEVFQ